jgi:recombinational DNA repair ATPase RecF
VLLELDLTRLNKIITAIAPGSQKIFTVTDTGRFAPELLQNMKIIKIENGRLT